MFRTYGRRTDWRPDASVWDARQTVNAAIGPSGKVGQGGDVVAHADGHPKGEASAVFGRREVGGLLGIGCEAKLDQHRRHSESQQDDERGLADASIACSRGDDGLGVEGSCELAASS